MSPLLGGVRIRGDARKRVEADGNQKKCFSSSANALIQECDISLWRLNGRRGKEVNRGEKQTLFQRRSR